jgi:hypothetical protein
VKHAHLLRRTDTFSMQPRWLHSLDEQRTIVLCSEHQIRAIKKPTSRSLVLGLNLFRVTCESAVHTLRVLFLLIASPSCEMLQALNYSWNSFPFWSCFSFRPVDWVYFGVDRGLCDASRFWCGTTACNISIPALFKALLQWENERGYPPLCTILYMTPRQI